MELTATGIVEITDNLTLKNPTLLISKVSYDWIDLDKVIVELLFKEGDGVYQHSRNFEFINNGGVDWQTADVISAINNHETLNVFS